MAEYESESPSAEDRGDQRKPARRTKARDERLLAAIDACAESAYGSDSDTALAQSRELAIRRYLGDNINPAPEGRSQVRDRTTFEVIEWTKPSLLRIFAGTDEVAKFDPQGPEDEAQAQQESDYLNYVVTRRNPWHQIVCDWLHDGLVCKNGYAVAYWDETKQTEEEEYDDLSDDAFALIANDPEVEIVEHEQEPDEALNAYNMQAYQMAMQQYQMQAMQNPQQAQPPQPPQPAFTHSVVIKRTNSEGRVVIETLAPERCKVDVNTKSHTLEGCTYFEYWDYQTIGQLRAQGFDVSDDISDAARDDLTYGTEETARNLYNEGLNRNFTDRPRDPSMRRVMVRYVWIRHDYNDDGIDEYKYAIVIGKEIMHLEDCVDIPVASFSPIPLPHRHIGMSLADTVADIEDINTNITRGAIDNLNLSNTPRMAASDRVNMDDLLDVRVGGVIRVDGQPPQELMPVMTPDVFPSAVQALSFFDSRRQNRTGINAYFQGTDSNVLNKTASGISQLTNSAAQRVELIARIFSFSVARLFSIVHKLLLTHGRKAETIKLRGQWVVVNPSEWKHRHDLRIVVGLGTGSKEGQIAMLSNVYAMQMQGMQIGTATPDNIYKTQIETAKAAGFTNAEAFFTDPQGKTPQAPPDPALEKAKIDAQLKAQLEQFSAQQAAQMEQMRQQFEAQMLMAKQAFDKWKVEFEAGVELQKEQMKASVAQDAQQAQIGMQREQMANENAKVQKDLVSNDEVVGSVSQTAEALRMISDVVAQMQQAQARRPLGIERIRDGSGRLVGARKKYDDGSTEDIQIQ